jgi:uncharacterized protein YbaR (Trm112 family)
MESSLRRVLRGKRMLTDPPTRAQRIGYRLGVEYVFWDHGTLERSLGMTEAKFDIHLWRKALQPFRVIDIEINSKLKIHCDLERPVLNSFLAGVIGGNVRGLCTKNDGEMATENFRERLRCVDCHSTQPLQRSDNHWFCENCKRKYPVVDDIIRILPAQLEEELISDNH